MNRRSFIKKMALAGTGIWWAQKTMGTAYLKSLTENTVRMPVLFMGHGNPMNAIDDNPFTRGWAKMAANVPTPKAILIVSAHWETRGGTRIYNGVKPKMIYDMYGFPQALYQVQYPAPGAPELADEIAEELDLITTHDWGLDHGAWSVLVKMFPDADIPCFQMSLNYTRELQWHYDLARQMRYLRDKGVLILCSGNIVHNLGYMRQMMAPAPEWALNFDAESTKAILEGNHKALINYKSFGQAAEISVNSAEHYIPMIYAMGLQHEGEPIEFGNTGIDQTLIGVGMRCIRVG